MELVREALNDGAARLATETEIEHHFPEFEPGAIPALPSLLHLPVVIDPELADRSVVTFAGGTQRRSVRVDAEGAAAW